MNIHYYLIVFAVMLLVGCQKEQKVIFEVQSVSYRQGDALFRSLIQEDCAKQSDRLSGYIGDGWKVVTSSQKEKVVMYDKGTCIGTEYVIEKSLPLFSKNKSSVKIDTKSVTQNNSPLAHKGTVVSTLATKEYTYIEVTNENNENVWLATTSMKIDKGNKIEYPETVPMKNFESKSLKKKFDNIYFVAGIRIIN